ncbi:MAG TPA: ribosome-associated translation inhibitor RaiA [candidate division Zixibacteria bacterium]|nr:ribosome-associated translation inhibitor RaiA [candidate division Zixibacteria bacterium]
MELRITGRRLDLTPEIKDYAETAVAGLDRFFDKIIDTHLILEVEKHRMRAELSVSVHGQQLIAHAETDDLYISIDDVVDKMQRQLKKYNAKMKDYRGMTDEEKKNLAMKLTEEIRENQDQL